MNPGEKGPGKRPAENDQWPEGVRKSARIRQNQNRNQHRAWPQRSDFFTLFDLNQFVVVVGKPGSGKSTQIPQWCLERMKTKLREDRKPRVVACAQNTRIPTICLAKKVSEEMDVVVGHQVGYSTLFESCCSRQTTLKYMLGDKLLQEIMLDPMLSAYDCIIIDEVHQRTLTMEFLMGYSKLLAPKRQDLKIVIMTAVLDNNLSDFFANVPIFTLRDGPSFHVEIFHEAELAKGMWVAAAKKVLKIHSTEPEGDILLFPDDENNIVTACRYLKAEIGQSAIDAGELEIIPLYSTLSLSNQERIFGPPKVRQESNERSVRKVFVAANNFETSLTIESVVYVVDPGIINEKYLIQNQAADFLQALPITQASAQYRADRAGRGKPGKCFRLYSEQYYAEMKPNAVPAILRSDPTTFFLKLKKLNIHPMHGFKYVNSPEIETLALALDNLRLYGATVEATGNITDLGKVMAEFPLDVHLAKSLVSTPDYDCSDQILSIMSIILLPHGCDRPFGEKMELAGDLGDHITLLHAFEDFQQNREDPQWCETHSLIYDSFECASNFKIELSNILDRHHLLQTYNEQDQGQYYMNICRALVAGYYLKTGSLDVKTLDYRTRIGISARVHPGLTGLKAYPPCVIYNHIMRLGGVFFLRTVTEAHEEGVEAMIPH